ncbi:MAG: TonB-dependent receptor, partial [Saprospiraceae bacterium]|nr:TonB-dependent receptor [Saprospiraceae bacterium]
FEPTTLILGRQQILNYYGYDYLGNPTGTNISFNDFFTATDATTGRKTRPVAPNKPIYVAGYLQDQFTYKDIICRFGVRFDSYDANTKVLNDPYSIAGYYTVSEFENIESPYTAGKASEYIRPSNIGDDFVVYVNENSPDASIVGFRDSKEQWYTADGLPVNNPNELGGVILPALRGFSSSENDPQGDNYDPDLAFSDYTPTVIVMPRIAFSFPISDKANFYANYDILAQRPPDATLATPMTYFNFREIATRAGSGGYINNPNLRSQRTINYEVGFQQELNKFSAIKLSLMYREERDLIQLREYILAYPISYTSYGNDDFSTTKSFKLEYDLRGNSGKVKNVRVLANYTLQFADGTGSSPTSSAGVAAQELKYIFPLNFDQRHTFFLNIDYRYKSGKDYNGPKIYGKKDSSGTAKSIDILSNTGLNLSFNANSGRPYTRKEIPGGIGTSFPNRNTEGGINGARVPWNFRVDLKIDKSFTIGEKSKNPVNVNVYFRVQNLLNTRNVLGVYAVTGSPIDDGFLTTEGSPGIALLESSALAYEMLYGLRMNDPFNISKPRRMFLGARFTF